jgi:phage terminase small subunit
MERVFCGYHFDLVGFADGEDLTRGGVKMAAGAAGRVATSQLSDVTRHGKDGKRNMPVLDFAKAEDFEAVREHLTSAEAKAVLDRYMKQQLTGTKYFTDKDMDALRRYCEAEGNHIIYSKEVAELRDAGDYIPSFITLKGKNKSETVQAYGCGGMEKLSREAAQTEANALGLNKSSRARVLEEVRQMNLDFGGEEIGDPVITEAKKDRLLTLVQLNNAA